MKTPTATTLRTQAHYGWIPDLPDKRDQVYSVVYKMPKTLPARIDLRKNCSAVEDQGQLGSCTANALAGALEFLECKTSKGKKAVDLSRLFIYYNERVIEHTANQDSGAMIRDGIKTLAKQGVCPESMWPYDIARLGKQPSAACYTRPRLTPSMATSGFPAPTKCAPASRMAFRSCSASPRTKVSSQAVAASGIIDLPAKTERAVSGHAVCAVDYDDKSQRFIVRNSWGADWGMKGYFTMPYAYLADRNLSDDFWTIRQFVVETASAKSKKN